MGKFTNILGAQITGNVGAVNFRKVDGEMVAAKRSYTNSSKGDGASYAQRLHRVRMANVATLFHQILLIERRGWENKKPNQTDFNMFTRANLASSPVMLTKQEAELGAAVIAPYAASRGSLSPVKPYYSEETVMEMNLCIGEIAVDDWETMTIADFSARIIANNPGWQYGDKLSVARLSQIERTVSGVTIPQVEVTYFEITLDAESSTVFIDIPNFGVLQPDATNPDASGKRWLRFLDGGDGFFAIHSRESAGYLECSSEDIIVQNLGSIIYVNHTSEAAKVAAMDSYGYKDQVLLDPYSESSQPIVPTMYITSIVANGDTVMYGGISLPLNSEIDIFGGGEITEDNPKVQYQNPNDPSMWRDETFDFIQPTRARWACEVVGHHRIVANGQTIIEFDVENE